MFAARLLPAALAALALTPPAASAAGGAIEPVELMAAPYIDDVGLWASPTGEAIATVTEGRDSPYRLLALDRGADEAAFGPPDELTQRLAAPPPVMGFDTRGAAFAVWRTNATLDRAEVASRPPGGPFTPALERDACGASASVAIGPASELALLCRGTVGPGPASYRVVLHTQPAIDSPDVLAVNLDTGIESATVTTDLAYGADGTLLSAWERPVDDGFEIRVSVIAPGAFPSAGTTLVPAREEARLDDVAVLPDGTVAVLVTIPDGVVAYVREPGGPFEEVEIDAGGTSEVAGDRLAVTPAGTLVATFTRRDGSGRQRTMYRERTPGGSLSPSEAVAGPGWRPEDLLVGADGTVHAALRLQRPGGGEVYAVAARPPGGDFGDPVEIPGAQAPARFALSPGGDVLAGWVDLDDGNDRLLLGGVDSGVAPHLHAVEVPAAVAIGETVAVSARASDGLALGELRWSFGDGATATGEQASHAYAAPGTYAVTVTAADRAGNERTAERIVQVVEPPPNGGDVPSHDDSQPGPDGSKPLPGDSTPLPGGGAGSPADDRRSPRLRVRAPRAVRVRRLRRRGVLLRIATDEPARVRVVVRHGRRTLATRRVAGAARTARVRMRVRVRPRRLRRPGRLRLRIAVTATDATGNRSRRVRRLVVRP